MVMTEVSLFLYTAVGHIVEKLEGNDLEHHFRPIGRSAEIWGICILAELVDKRKVNCFVQEFKEVVPGSYTIVDAVPLEGKLA